MNDPKAKAAEAYAAEQLKEAELAEAKVIISGKTFCYPPGYEERIAELEAQLELKRCQLTAERARAAGLVKALESYHQTRLESFTTVAARALQAYRASGEK